MTNGVSDSAVFDGITLLARLSDLYEVTIDNDDSFDYLKAGMVEVKWYKINSSYSKVVNSSVSNDNDVFDEGSNFAYDPSEPGHFPAM